MGENGEWNRAFPWLYPYGGWMDRWNLWSIPERAEDEADFRRLQELYPVMARRIQPYVEDVCDRLEYPGSMMYDEYPDRLSLLRKAREAWDAACRGENFGEKEPEWEKIRDLIGVLLLQEMTRRRRRNRGQFRRSVY